MPRFKTFANLGDLIPNDINRLVSEINAAMLPWRTIFSGSVTSLISVGGDHKLTPGTVNELRSWNFPMDASSGTFTVGDGLGGDDQMLALYDSLIYLDPQDHGVRVGRLRWRVQIACVGPAVVGAWPEAVATSYGANLTVALYPITNVVTHGEASFVSQGFPMLQASAVPVAGSVYTVAPPPVGGQGKLAFSNSMSMPSIGNYVGGVTVSNAPNTDVETLFKAELQFRPEKI